MLPIIGFLVVAFLIARKLSPIAEVVKRKQVAGTPFTRSGSPSATLSNPDTFARSGSPSATLSNPDTARQMIGAWTDDAQPTIRRDSPRGDFSYDPEVDDAIDADIESTLSRELSTALQVLVSPLRNVADDQWRQFVAWARRGKLATITPSYCLGIYLISPKQLADFGYMRNVRKVQYLGRDVYNGEWVEPYSKDAFLSSPALQYEAFSRIVINRVNVLQVKYRSTVGKPLPGVPGTVVSFSGLLAVAMVAGITGLDKWLGETAETRHERTTDAFTAMNGRF